MRSNSIIGFALLLAACGNADLAQAPAASALVAEAQSPAAPISNNPHPAEMATHCLRVLGAGLDDARAERCKSERLWAASTGRTGPLSDGCLLHRLTSDAYSTAIASGIIPSGSPDLYQNMLGLNDCIVAGEVIRLAPVDDPDSPGEADRLAFIGFALRAIGENRKWSAMPATDSTDLAGMCEAFEAATDEAIKAQAGEALGCRW